MSTSHSLSYLSFLFSFFSSSFFRIVGHRSSISAPFGQDVLKKQNKRLCLCECNAQQSFLRSIAFHMFMPHRCSKYSSEEIIRIRIWYFVYSCNRREQARRKTGTDCFSYVYISLPTVGKQKMIRFTTYNNTQFWRKRRGGQKYKISYAYAL